MLRVIESTIAWKKCIFS